MKISTWNLMRPNSTTVERNTIFQNTLKEINSDIVVLTETNSLIDFGNDYNRISTTVLPSSYEGIEYKEGENRVTIYSKLPFIRQIRTADSYTSVCAEVATQFGNLIIYGTIIGPLGGKGTQFDNDLSEQMKDIERMLPEGDICFTGDLNISFTGFPYPSHDVINRANNFFNAHSLENLTGHIPDCAIHNIISSSFLKGIKKSDVTELLFDKKVTDHRLITVTFEA